MDDKKKSTVTNEELRAAFEGDRVRARSSGSRPPIKKAKSQGHKKYLVFSIVGGVCLAAGLVCLAVAFLALKTDQAVLDFGSTDTGDDSKVEYSALTGAPLASGAAKNAPTYCIQTPNGTDGARPQAGLNEAGVVFEAIAESGITRFAAIYQDPSTAIIGPIRSLRIYYLEWDAPFDCAIVHAGGADDALAAVSSGGYRDLSEDYNYMYRGTYGGRLWNNLFTTAADLKQFSTDHSFNSSEIKGFARLTPKESDAERANESVSEKLIITKATTENTSETEVPVPSIAFNLGGWADFNVNYDYDAESNTYLRSYASGAKHEVYSCPDENLGQKNPEDVCTLKQMAPSVVVAMVVQESKAADNYHENITATGSGDAYVFQNGTVIKGSWSKTSVKDQIKFTDNDGKEIKLAPGQTFITAVPKYGSVAY